MSESDQTTFIPSPLPILAGLFLYTLGISLAALIVMPGLVLQAWVGTILWGWFVVPFFKLPVLPVAIALGARFTARVLFGSDERMTNLNDGHTRSERLTFALSKSFLSPLVLLVLGYIVHLYV